MQFDTRRLTRSYKQLQRSSIEQIWRRAEARGTRTYGNVEKKQRSC